jgi:hypothetical protein
MVSSSAVFTAAWSAYRLARPAIWATGDETGTRRFLRDLFNRQLRTAWAAAKKAARIAASDETARAFVAAQRRVAVAKAAAMPEAERSARIAAIRDDLETLQYAPLRVRVSQKRAVLTDELAVLTAA